MGLETATYINALVATNPTSADPKSQGDDHIRLLKYAIKASFPNVAGAVTASHTELNLLTGITYALAAADGSNLTTPLPGDSSTKIATTAFVAAAALSATLPGQTGNNGKYLKTDGVNATWQPAPTYTTLSGYGITDAAPLSHTTDAAVHLTTGQNTFLDAIEANGTTAQEINSLRGLGYTTSTPTSVAVEVANNSLFRFQTVANFFNKLGQILHFNADRGRKIYTAGALTLVAGNTYVVNASTAFNLTMPAIADTQEGDTICILPWYYHFGATYYTDIVCPAGVDIYIGKNNIGAGNTLRNDFGAITLRCSYWQTGTAAIWEAI